MTCDSFTTADRNFTTTGKPVDILITTKKPVAGKSSAAACPPPIPRRLFPSNGDMKMAATNAPLSDTVITCNAFPDDGDYLNGGCVLFSDEQLREVCAPRHSFRADTTGVCNTHINADRIELRQFVNRAISSGRLPVDGGNTKRAWTTTGYVEIDASS